MTPDEVIAALRGLSRPERCALLAAMAHALLPVWTRYAAEQGELTYIESVVGTHQIVDRDLPRRALLEVDVLLDGQAVDSSATDHAYAEPLSALQSGDIDFGGGAALLAWYAIANVFHYVRDQPGWRDVDAAIVRQFANALDLDAAALGRWWHEARSRTVA